MKLREIFLGVALSMLASAFAATYVLGSYKEKVDAHDRVLEGLQSFEKTTIDTLARIEQRLKDTGN